MDGRPPGNTGCCRLLRPPLPGTLLVGPAPYTATATATGASPPPPPTSPSPRVTRERVPVRVAVAVRRGLPLRAPDAACREQAPSWPHAVWVPSRPGARLGAPTALSPPLPTPPTAGRADTCPGPRPSLYPLSAGRPPVRPPASGAGGDRDCTGRPEAGRPPTPTPASSLAQPGHPGPGCALALL